MTAFKSLCVYCGWSSRGRKSHHAAAGRLGGILADAGIRLIYGGGSVGVMGMLADAVAEGGGEVIGVIRTFLDELEIGRRNCTELISSPTACMAASSGWPNCQTVSLFCRVGSARWTKCLRL